MSVALSIAFTGLCALIGDGDGRPGQVLLLDAKGVGQVGGVTLPEHGPTLVVSLNDLANPDSSRPTRIIAGRPTASGRLDQLGMWDLTGSEVRIRPQGGVGEGLHLFRPSQGETSWPEPPRDPRDPAAWRDLRFVPNMKSLVGDGRINPALLGTGGASPSELPASIAARIHLDAGLLEGAIPSQETFREDVFEFRSAGSSRVVRQALTDTIQWTLESEANAIVIDITPANGGPAKRLLLAPSAEPHRLFVSNLPADNESHVHSASAANGDDMSGLHFGAYYKLLLNEPADRPIPVLAGAAHSRKGVGLGRPVFCSAAIFTLQ
jgi:hypothetical protein